MVQGEFLIAPKKVNPYFFRLMDTQESRAHLANEPDDPWRKRRRKNESDPGQRSFFSFDSTGEGEHHV
jgi:hypothetical protein